MGKPEASAKRTREALRQRMASCSKEPVVKVIRFDNDDVPKYLKNLRRFQAESRRVRIMTE